MVDGHHPVVHLAAHHPVAHRRVDGIGEVDAGGPGRQVDDVPLGGKGKDFLGQKVALEVVQQVARILRDPLVFQQLAHPGQPVVQLVVAAQALLVLPVGGDAVLGLFVHLAGADLHLEGDALVPDDGGVQALVAVGFGGGDIVLEAVGQRVVHIVDQAQRAVALGDGVQDDPDGVDVVDLVKGLVLHEHLAVDAVDALDPALHGRAVDAALLQPLFDQGRDAGQEFLARTLAQKPADLLVAHRVEVVEAAVLQFLLDVQNAQTVGDGGVDLHGLAGLVPALLLGPGVAGPHIVQPVAELDDHDPHVLAHGQQHLAQVFGLLLLDAGKLDLGQLGDAVHQQGHLGPKGRLDLLDGDGGILHHVVQQGGGDALGVHPQVQHQPGHRQRVADIGLAAAAAGVLVGLVGHAVGLFDHLGVVGPAAGLDSLGQLFVGDDLGPRLGGDHIVGCLGRGGRGHYRADLPHLMLQVGLGGIGILHGGRRFLSLWHITFPPISPPNTSGWAHRPGFSCR